MPNDTQWQRRTDEWIKMTQESRKRKQEARRKAVSQPYRPPSEQEQKSAFR